MNKENSLKYAIYNRYYDGEITLEDRNALLKALPVYLESNAMDRYTDKALKDRRDGLKEMKSTIKNEVLNPNCKNKKDSFRKLHDASKKRDEGTYRYNTAIKKGIDPVDYEYRKTRFDDPEDEAKRREYIRSRKAARDKGINEGHIQFVKAKKKRA